MGIWGPGNFDNNDSLNYIQQETNRLISTIEAIFADEERFHLDEEAEAILIPSVALLSLLCKNCRAIIPKSLDILAWKDQYLLMYDHEIVDWEDQYLQMCDRDVAYEFTLRLPENYAYQRRAVIAATFDKLLQQQYAIWKNAHKEE